ncbi:hypothetical protein M513_02021 [Trichuris suis]|uniref:Uncharacterized protein n=1 Tax=Trichuris suis TaxID=68888 RepID=A0A085MIU0_9BILA|nr:hypothetical protein M513_02021 [Trichuris suis]
MDVQQKSKEFTLAAWKQSQDDRIRELLFNAIPSRIVKLLEILNGSLFSTVDYDEFLAGFKRVREFEIQYPIAYMQTNRAYLAYAELLKKNPLFSPNQRVSAMSKILEPILMEAAESFERISNWIETLKPEVSSGNNFGVSVQEEVLSEAAEMCYASNKMLVSLRKYHTRRSSLLLFFVKYPFVEDLKEAICEVDESEFWSLRFKLIAVIDNYAALHDVIQKNLPNILSPPTVIFQMLSSFRAIGIFSTHVRSCNYGTSGACVSKNSKSPLNNERIVEHFVTKMDEHNQISAARSSLKRRRSNLAGLLLGFLVVGIYVYTIRAVKEEDFLDDTNPPDNIN